MQKWQEPDSRLWQPGWLHREDRSHDIPFVFQLLRGKLAIWLCCCCDKPFFNPDAPSATRVCCGRLIRPTRNVTEVNHKSEARHHFNIQANGAPCARALSLVYNLAQLNVVEAAAEAGAQQAAAVDGRQRNQRAGTVQR